MSNTISGGISFGGIGSGMDMNAIVDQLKKVQEIPVNRLKLNQAEYKYRIDALNAVMDVMREANDIFKKFNTPAKMFNLNVESSKSEVASATLLGNSELTDGSYTIDVKQIAKPSLFTSKKVFEDKDAVINPPADKGGTTKHFTYTYKGSTRTIDIPPGTTLDQFMKRINNDALNPGVKASLIKSGDGYMFQIQGKDTGKNAELSISSDLDFLDGPSTLFTGKDVAISKEETTFSYWYGGKERSFKVTANMTAQQFVDEFNKDGNQPVKAKLVQNGSDYTIEFADRKTGEIVNIGSSSTIPMLGGKKFGSENDVVNNTDKKQTISYNFMGKKYSIEVDLNATVKDVVNKINAQSADKHPDLTASFNQATGQIEFTRKDATIENSGGKDMNVSFEDTSGKEHEFTVSSGIGLKEYVEQFNKYAQDNKLDVTAKLDVQGDTAKIVYEKKDGGTLEVTSDNNVISGKSSIQLQDVKSNPGFYSPELEGFGKKEVISGKNSLVNSGSSPQQFSAEFEGGQKVEFEVTAGMTLQEFADKFNQTSTNGVKAEIVESPSGYKLVYTKDGKEVQPTKVKADGLNGLGAKGDNWYEQKAQDAVFTINGWDKEFTSDTNKLTEVIEGMEITLKSEGQTVLTVSSDTSKLKENVKEVVDAINSVKKAILDLSKVDEDKETNKPEDGTLSSQLTWQKGGVLTGNYGIQLFLTEYNSIVTGSGGGFAKKESVDDLFGDAFTVLSELGISTNTNAGDDDFGLLIIDEEKLDKAIEEDPDAVVELLSSPLSGTTSSSEFVVASTGLHAKPGKYDVTYDVDANGKAINVYINGAKAHNDPEYPGRWTVADPDNEAAGVAIQFPDGGMAQGTGYKGEIRIKQGKLNELSQYLTEELTTSTVPGVEQGKIPTMISSYQQNIDNLQLKIDAETERIALWEKRERLKFSRLEETLTKYNTQMQSISSMTAGLYAGR